MLPILNRNMHFTYAAVGVKEQSFEQYNFPMGLSTLFLWRTNSHLIILMQPAYNL